METLYFHFSVHTVEWQVDETQRVAACQTAAIVALYQTLSVNKSADLLIPVMLVDHGQTCR